MSFKDTQSYKELQADWRWIHSMDPEAAAAADQWVKEHPEEWKELEHGEQPVTEFCELSVFLLCYSDFLLNRLHHFLERFYLVSSGDNYLHLKESIFCNRTKGGSIAIHHIKKLLKS